MLQKPDIWGGIEASSGSEHDPAPIFFDQKVQELLKRVTGMDFDKIFRSRLNEKELEVPKFNLELLKEGVKRTNTLYGGKDLKVTRVVFPNGSIDPWHALGITDDLSPEATAIFINGTAHCANMYPEKEDDPPQLLHAREQVFNHIQKWLQE
ncbi:putative serine protease F56F10.1 [Penaeus vannamei]|uniref:Putative serine protease F56F10.1 n=1 Tax=Penaeus vannamei TaxID=6689 RepID=A0A423U620_PENVA|nr:putative serine protease F56F10.1 [Penaeus vannamei]